MWGGIASAVGSIAGGLIGAASSQSANSSNIEAAALANDKAYERQKEFAQHGIRWKVEDAKAAGLHPLAALGTNTATYTPSGLVGTSSGTDYSWLGDAGQGIGRAVSAGLTRQERQKQQQVRDEVAALDIEHKRAQIQNQRLHNQLLQQDIVRQQTAASERAIVNQQLGPSIPMKSRPDGAIIDGQGDAISSKFIKTKPAEIVANMPSRPWTEAGTITEVGYGRTKGGGYVPVMSSDAKNRYEDDTIGTLGWNLRNRLPALVFDYPSSAPPKSYLPSGYDDWTYNFINNAWYPVKRGDWLGRVNKRFNPFLD